MKGARCNITSFLSDGLGESSGRAFSSEGRMWNADHRLKESTIQSASLPCALLGWEGICQVKTVASIF